jgi:hypothetical protein
MCWLSLAVSGLCTGTTQVLLEKFKMIKYVLADKGCMSPAPSTCAPGTYHSDLLHPNGFNDATIQWWILQRLHHKLLLVGSSDLHNGPKHRKHTLPA